MKKRPKTMLKTDYGCVRVYVRRHIGECRLRDPNEVNCGCPLWFYLSPVDGRAVQQAAKTTSFTEAVTKAKRVLKAFDPEIAAAREINEPTPGIDISR